MILLAENLSGFKLIYLINKQNFLKNRPHFNGLKSYLHLFSHSITILSTEKWDNSPNHAFDWLFCVDDRILYVDFG